MSSSARALKYFQIAKDISQLSDYRNGRCRLGCVLVHKNRIISSGCNSNKTSPLQGRYNKYRGISDEYPSKLHAETAAIKPLLNSEIDWSSVHLYLYREHADGSLALSRPCKSCMALIKDVGIREIHYTTEDGYATEQLSVDR